MSLRADRGEGSIRGASQLLRAILEEAGGYLLAFVHHHILDGAPEGPQVLQLFCRALDRRRHLFSPPPPLSPVNLPACLPAPGLAGQHGNPHPVSEAETHILPMQVRELAIL